MLRDVWFHLSITPSEGHAILTDERSPLDLHDIRADDEGFFAGSRAYRGLFRYSTFESRLSEKDPFVIALEEALGFRHKSILWHGVNVTTSIAPETLREISDYLAEQGVGHYIDARTDVIYHNLVCGRNPEKGIVLTPPEVDTAIEHLSR